MSLKELEAWFDRRRVLEQWVSRHPGMTASEVASMLMRMDAERKEPSCASEVAGLSDNAAATVIK